MLFTELLLDFQLIIDMALLTCPDCGNRVSDKADACPVCGKPVARILEELSCTVKPRSETLQDTIPQTQRVEEYSSQMELADSQLETKEQIKITDGKPEIARKQINYKLLGFIVSAIIIIGGGLAYILIGKPFSMDNRVARVQRLLDSRKYDEAETKCDKFVQNFGHLSSGQRMTISEYYKTMAERTGDKTKNAKYNEYLRMMFDLDDRELISYMDIRHQEGVNHLRISRAGEQYLKGKTGLALSLCEDAFKSADNLPFTDKCDLASLLWALGSVGSNRGILQNSMKLYDQVMALNKGEALAILTENDKKYSTDLVSSAKSSRVGFASDIVIVTGNSVRLRKGPSLNSDIITDFYWNNIHPAKGAHLEYLGEAADFYRVRYNGMECWISKQYSIVSKSSR